MDAQVLLRAGIAHLHQTLLNLGGGGRRARGQEEEQGHHNVSHCLRPLSHCAFTHFIVNPNVSIKLFFNECSLCLNIIPHSDFDALHFLSMRKSPGP